MFTERKRVSVWSLLMRPLPAVHPWVRGCRVLEETWRKESCASVFLLR